MVQIKRLFSISVFLIFATVSFAQDFSYGVSLSRIYPEMNNSGSTLFYNTKQIWATGVGVYGEYNFTQNYGVKAELTYLSKEMDFTNSLIDEYRPYKFSNIELAPSFKVDFGNEYRHGFYMMIGPKLTVVTSVTPEDMDFNKTTFGSQLALGYRVFKFIDIQAKIDYDFTPVFEFDNRKSSFFAGGFSIGVDLERVINPTQ